MADAPRLRHQFALDEVQLTKLKVFFNQLGTVEKSNLVVELGPLMELPYVAPKSPMGATGLHALSLSIGSRLSLNKHFLFMRLATSRGAGRRVSHASTFAA